MKTNIEIVVAAWEAVWEDTEKNIHGGSLLKAAGVSLEDICGSEKLKGIMDAVVKAHRVSAFSRHLKYLQHEVDAVNKLTKKVPHAVKEEQDFRTWVKTNGRKLAELKANVSKQDVTLEHYINHRCAELAAAEHSGALRPGKKQKANGCIRKSLLPGWEHAAGGIMACRVGSHVPP